MKKCSICKNYFDSGIGIYCKKIYKEKVYQYYMCHGCNSARARKYRHTSDYSKQYLRLKNKLNYKLNRDKVLARSAVARALKRGILIKPKDCSKCGKCVKLQGHHEDYSKCLDVVWLCVPCHRLFKEIPSILG